VVGAADDGEQRLGPRARRAPAAPGRGVRTPWWRRTEQPAGRPEAR